MPPLVHFEVLGCDPLTSARAGILHTPHGLVPTPAFAPVGTQGAVKAVTPRDLGDLGVAIMMVNAYHLAVRPGADTVSALGALHEITGWEGPLMADSGGYQIFSLGKQATFDTDGVTFQSPTDGTSHRFTPESVVALQERLGPDLALPLDVCTPYPASRERAAADMTITHDWARRSREAHGRTDQALYGIVQGSTYADLRAESARTVSQIGFDGYAVGGVSVGEPKEAMLASVNACARLLPPDAPRHLLGVGHPEDLVECVALGMDTFDCVMPTRVARNAGALTMAGRINLRNAAFTTDRRAIEPECSCYACQHFSRGAVRHLVKAGEILGLHLLTIHNLHFTLDLMRSVRAAILAGSFAAYRREFLRHYAGGAHALQPVIA